jgi:hypothetical protein
MSTHPEDTGRRVPDTGSVTRTERSAALWATAVMLTLVVVPWWAMRSGEWVPVTLGLWLASLAVGVTCVVAGDRLRATGWAVLLGTASAVALFVTLYLVAFAWADWD